MGFAPVPGPIGGCLWKGRPDSFAGVVLQLQPFRNCFGDTGRLLKREMTNDTLDIAWPRRVNIQFFLPESGVFIQ